MKLKKIIFSCLPILAFGFSLFSLNSCNKAHEHNWVEKERILLTCTEDERIIYECDGCDETDIVVLEKAQGHNEIIDSGYDATCEESGLTEGKHCDICGETIVAQKIIEPTGHNYEDYICSECGYNYCTDGLVIGVVDGINTVLAYHGTDNEIVIPSIYENLPVTCISSDVFKERRTITSIYIPDSITSIGDYAFSECNLLKNV